MISLSWPGLTGISVAGFFFYHFYTLIRIGKNPIFREISPNDIPSVHNSYIDSCSKEFKALGFSLVTAYSDVKAHDSGIENYAAVLVDASGEVVLEVISARIHSLGFRIFFHLIRMPLQYCSMISCFDDRKVLNSSAIAFASANTRRLTNHRLSKSMTADQRYQSHRVKLEKMKKKQGSNLITIRTNSQAMEAVRALHDAQTKGACGGY